MKRRLFWHSMIGALAVVATGAYAEEVSKGLLDALLRKFAPSWIEIAQPGRQGVVTRRGRLIVLAIDGIPAMPFRVTRAGPGSPAVHVMDFAVVEVTATGRVVAKPGPLTLDTGTHLVVLDVQVNGDRVHLLTHTADPIQDAAGAVPVYGCTEFVFRIEPHELKAEAFDYLAERIDRAFAWTPLERVCAPGVDPLCVEP